MQKIVIRTKCPKCNEVFSVETNVSEPRRRPLAPLKQKTLDLGDEEIEDVPSLRERESKGGTDVQEHERSRNGRQETLHRFDC